MESLFDGIIFENQCICCGKPRISADIPLCRQCVAMLRPSLYTFSGIEGCNVYYLCRYNEVSGTLIKSFKYDSLIEAGIFMAVMMSAGIETLSRETVLSYIPFDRIKKYNRFFNHAEMLADTIAYMTGLRSARLLRRKISFFSQARLPSFIREKRHIRFSSRSTEEKSIMIIDDVITSGGTMRGAIYAVKSANPHAEVSGLCFAGH